MHSNSGTWQGKAWIYTYRVWCQNWNHVWHAWEYMSFMIACVRCVGYVWMVPLKEVGSTCQMPSLVNLFGWWMGCANMWFCKPFDSCCTCTVKRLGFNSPMKQLFFTIILTCSQYMHCVSYICINNVGCGCHVLGPPPQNVATYTRHKNLSLATSCLTSSRICHIISHPKSPSEPPLTSLEVPQNLTGECAKSRWTHSCLSKNKNKNKKTTTLP